MWYKKVPLKKDGIASIMKNMTQIAKLDNEGHFAPTTGRKTAIQSLRNKFGPVSTISELTGHADPASILQYSHNPLNVQRRLCSQLADVRQINTPTSTSTTVQQQAGSRRSGEQDQASASGGVDAIFHSSVLHGCTINIQYSGR